VLSGGFNHWCEDIIGRSVPAGGFNHCCEDIIGGRSVLAGGLNC
jgi:hypothetical protein